MGISYQATIVLGRPVSKLSKELQNDDLREIAEDHGMELVSPFFDAPDEDCLIGFGIQETNDYSWEILNFEDLNNITEKAVLFQQITGLKPNLYLTTKGS